MTEVTLYAIVHPNLVQYYKLIIKFKRQKLESDI